MIFKNPLVLVTIPLALALSVIWFRRKKLFDTGGDDQNRSKSTNTREETVKKEQQQNTEQSKHSNDSNQRDFSHSISVPIGGVSCTPLKKSATTPATLNNNELNDFKFGKSAPIDITPHKTSPSRSKNGSNESDDKSANGAAIEGITTKNDGLDFKLNSIEESSLDSVDLPGSITCRRRFSFTIRTNEPPIVVKASAMDAKDVNKSPQSSFEALNSTSPPSPSPSPPKAAAQASQSASSGPASTSKSMNSISNKSASKGAPVRNSFNTTPSKPNHNKTKTEKKSKMEKKPTTNASTANNSGDKDTPKKSLTTTTTSSSSTNNNERVLPVASPPLSLCSNKSNQSHDSGDSGKGSSPANSEGGNTLSSLQSYDFELAHNLVGFLVGKGGATVRRIRDECKVTISIKRHPTKFRKCKLCSVYGTQQQIDAAMAMIKSKMPPKTKLERIDIELETAEMIAAISQIDTNRLQLNLIDGINNDVAVCAVINGGHLFLQQPLHPSYMSLNVLQNCMNQSYSSFESPMLPNYSVGTVCVGQIDGHWYRLEIIEYQPNATVCIAKYLDFGGYCEIQTTELRQIRTDFMTVPFQAIECLLADIKPKADGWSVEASQAIVELTQYRTLQAQIASYTDTGLPEIHLYSYLSPNNIVFINKELVARNYAEWCDPVSNV